MYEIGRVYIWQNQTHETAHLNGQETTVLSGPATYRTTSGKLIVAQMTDTYPDIGAGVVAAPGDLRPKDRPPGELKIFDMFRLTEFNY